MTRSIFLLLVISVLLYSCGNSKPDNSVSKNETAVSQSVLFDSLVVNPEAYIGKTIYVSGKVVHVCTETGKKMFITGQNPDIRLYVAAGDKISKFPMELLGSEITVEGLVVKAPVAANTEMNDSKDEMEEKKCDKEMGAACCETEKAVKSQLSLADIRMEYRSHTVK